MSAGISTAGKVVSIIFWIIALWSFTADGSVLFVKAVRIIAALTLAAHLVEVGMFLTQSKYKEHEKGLNSLQILLFGIFHLGTLKK